MPVLDVGGVQFPTTWVTLRAENCFFSCLEDDYTFIDRDPTHFRYILNYLRGAVVLPRDRRALHELRVEADFYSLRGLVSAVDNLLADEERASMADLVSAVQQVARAVADGA